MWFHSQIKWFETGFHSHAMWSGEGHLLRVGAIIIARHYTYRLYDYAEKHYAWAMR
ncbi:hypothetical protein QON05_004615 [Salmonella enterica]|uniref:hypothetical protein n=1 Tax=Salmonella enterica TaxID=28901 RepID=UPI001D58380A|nr:hypothetical protein [Salmonella enterica]EFO9812135.1 hypothetical protein [Salmonella enterica subsp. enterica serovar Enteritidis]MCH5484432.1 hypothetical protein [Salmonella enterica subsp. diarizonae serovar 16:z10:e,n,x,z15]EKK6187203.1 hypothetical protein [Salmonella enterica]ELH5318367.1 hypothetical protein [Salmonella enterica]